jgi:glycosyltransferase involved in cell wall biosynthesis
MLSLLLPVYNFPCFDLAREMTTQALASNVPFELICIDDCSSNFKKDNQPIGDLPYATYIELDKNIGRSRIRNLLVSKAKYDYVLFVDCDSRIPHSNYIQKYLQEIKHSDIVAGGTLYEPYPPQDSAYYLHWKYGSVRELKPDNLQQKTFTSNNFVIKKSIISKYPFNEKIVRYGHEDSLFQMELEKHGFFIRFINNPVIHIGLETNIRFIEKTQESMLNLCDLYHAHTFDDLNMDKIKLLKTYLLIKKYKIDSIFDGLFPVIDFFNRKINLSKHPSLFVLDIYKLAFFIHIFRSKAG